MKIILSVFTFFALSAGAANHGAGPVEIFVTGVERTAGGVQHGPAKTKISVLVISCSAVSESDLDVTSDAGTLGAELTVILKPGFRECRGPRDESELVVSTVTEGAIIAIKNPTLKTDYDTTRPIP